MAMEDQSVFYEKQASAATKKKARRDVVACWSFTHSVLFCFGFTWTFVLHESLTYVNELERLIKFELEEKSSSKNVHDARLFWQWVEKDLLPTLITQTDARGKKLSKEQWGFVAMNNLIVGGIRFKQERRTVVKCQRSFKSQIYDVCSSRTAISSESFGRSPCRSNSMIDCYNESRYRGSVDTLGNEGFAFDAESGVFEIWLDALEEESVLYERIHYLEDRLWLDRYTSSIGVDILFLNNQHEPLLCLARLLFEFSPTGYIDSKTSIETVSIEPYALHSAQKHIFGAMYVVGVVLIFVNRCYAAVRIWRRLGRTFVATLSVLQSQIFIHCVDLAAGGMGLALVVLWLGFMSEASSAVDAVDALSRPVLSPLHNANDFDIWKNYHQDVVEIEEKVHDLIVAWTTIRCLASLMMFLLIARLFNTWETMPGMQIVPKTVIKAFNNLLGVAIAILILICVWAAVGMILYGHQIQEFASFGSAVRISAYILVIGEHDLLESLREVMPFLGSLWYWSLVIVLYLTLLNVVLAIIVISFEETSNDLDSSTLLELSCRVAGYYIRKAKVSLYAQRHQGLPSSSPSPPITSIDQKGEEHPRIMASQIWRL